MFSIIHQNYSFSVYPIDENFSCICTASGHHAITSSNADHQHPKTRGGHQILDRYPGSIHKCLHNLVFLLLRSFLRNATIFGIVWTGSSFLVTTWIVYNILENLRLCVTTLNTVDSLPPQMQQPMKGEEHLWHFCKICQRNVPPRSWHCNICDACILKRDHHCNFVGNCVGHNNQRYFIWFSFYAAIGSAVALFDNFMLAHKHGVGFLI